MSRQNKTVRIAAALCAAFLAVTMLAGCHTTYVYDEEPEVDTTLLTIGFSQIGAESGYRTANTDNMKETFTIEAGYNLLYDDGQQKQEKQVTAIRNFIQQEVDYIILAPVTETGWDTVLQEARDASIPVLIIDRMVDVADESLYTASIGSDFYSEGEKACAWLKEYLDANGIQADAVHIADIQGTLGASAQLGRTQALEDAASRYGWEICATEGGDFVYSKGQEAVQKVLRIRPEVNILYCENDNEAFGAIKAVKEAGKTIGGDIENGEIMIMSFDATREGLEYVLSGDIMVDTECDPLYGPRVEEIIRQLEAGEETNKNTYVDESVYAADDTVRRIHLGGVSYPVEVVTQELIDGRAY